MTDHGEVAVKRTSFPSLPELELQLVDEVSALPEFSPLSVFYALLVAGLTLLSVRAHSITPNISIVYFPRLGSYMKSRRGEPCATATSSPILPWRVVCLPGWSRAAGSGRV